MYWNFAICCLGLSPLTYGVKVAFLSIFTLFFLWLMKRKVKKPKYQELPGLGKWKKSRRMASLFAFALLFSYLVYMFTCLSMTLVLSWIIRGYACIHYCRPSYLEMCIPLLGCLLIAASHIKTRFSKIARYPLLVILVLCISLSIALSIKSMIGLFLYFPQS